MDRYEDVIEKIISVQKRLAYRPDLVKELDKIISDIKDIREDDRLEYLSMLDRMGD